jgi:hypothetical protein
MLAPVMRKMVPLSLVVLGALAVSSAQAAPFDKVFFVKQGGTAAGLFADREACAEVAEKIALSRGGEAYGDPDYGMLVAMGSALDADSMGGDIGKAVRRAALEKCMEKRGWSQLDPAEAEEKSVRRASLRDPGALDAWLKAHEPAVVQTAAAPSPSAPPASTSPTAAPPTAAVRVIDIPPHPAPAAAPAAVVAAPSD